jgi:hypothetical protein
MTIFFGDIFEYAENYYVFLASDEDSIYAAKILDKEITIRLVSERNKKSKSSINRTQENQLFCFVILSTKNFQDQAAHYGKQPQDINLSRVVAKLNSNDQEALKSEISEDQALSPRVKELIKKCVNNDDGSEI